MKVKLTLSFMPLLFNLILPSYSQTDSIALKRYYEKEVIYFSGNKYVKNDNLYPLSNLESEFKKNSEGYVMYELARIDNRKSTILSTIGLIGYFASFTMLENNPEAGLTAMIISSIPIFISIPISVRGDKRLKKAVWLRNRDVLTTHSY